MITINIYNICKDYNLYYLFEMLQESLQESLSKILVDNFIRNFGSKPALARNQLII